MNIAERLRDRANQHREYGWELMREGDPSLLEAAADEIEAHVEVHKDHKRLVRELDVLLNGVDGAAPQASLCDIVAQLADWRRKQTAENE